MAFSKSIRLAGVAALWLAVPPALPAQSPRAFEIPDAITCNKCTLNVMSATALTSSNPDGEISSLPLNVRRDARGRYWVINDQEMPRVFGPDGKFVQHVGRRGAGPGEYMSPFETLPLPGDSVLIIDYGNMRANVVGPTFKYVRQLSITMPLANSIVLSWPTAVVGFQVGGSTSADAMVPLHIASFAGKDMTFTRSFGPKVAPSDFRAMESAYQSLAAAPNGEILSAPRSAYRLFVWNGIGVQQRSYARHPVWFSDSTRTGIGTPTTAPPPSLGAVATVNDSVVLACIRLPSATWKNGWARLGKGQSEASMKQIDFDVMFTTRVEALDLKHNAVLARAELPGVAISTIGNNMIAMYQTGADGLAHVNILRIDLVTSR